MVGTLSAHCDSQLQKQRPRPARRPAQLCCSLLSWFGLSTRKSLPARLRSAAAPDGLRGVFWVKVAVLAAFISTRLLAVVEARVGVQTKSWRAFELNFSRTTAFLGPFSSFNLPSLSVGFVGRFSGRFLLRHAFAFSKFGLGAIAAGASRAQDDCHDGALFSFGSEAHACRRTPVGHPF